MARPKPGDIVPSLPQLPFRGQGWILVTFFKSDCPTSPLALPYVERIHRVFGAGVGFQVLGISQDDPGETRAFVERVGVTFPVEHDEGWAISAAWELEAVPTLVLVDDEGRVVAGHAGLNKAELNALAAKVAEHLGRKPMVVAPEDDGVPAWRPG